MRRALGLAATALLASCQGQPEGKSPQAEPSPAPVPSPSVATGPIAQSVSCAAGEPRIFTCDFTGGKQVAVCGTKAGNAEYRFGGDTRELVLSGGERAYTMYSGGGESQLAFDNGDTRYIVFSRVVRTGFDENGNRPAISDGVVVERAGKFLSIKTCDDPDVVPVNLAAAETFLPDAALPDDQFLFTNETIRADSPGNE